MRAAEVADRQPVRRQRRLIAAPRRRSRSAGRGARRWRTRGAGCAGRPRRRAPTRRLGLEVERHAERLVDLRRRPSCSSSRRRGAKTYSPSSAGRRRATPTSSDASRSAPSRASRRASSAPPGHDHVPPSWENAERSWSITSGTPSPSTVTNTTPAAPNRPQRTWPSLQRTNPSPLRAGRPWRHTAATPTRPTSTGRARSRCRDSARPVRGGPAVRGRVRAGPARTCATACRPTGRGPRWRSARWAPRRCATRPSPSTWSRPRPLGSARWPGCIPSSTSTVTTAAAALGRQAGRVAVDEAERGGVGRRDAQRARRRRACATPGRGGSCWR